ncbi:MAG: MmgE/PrpD family protein [Ruminococcus sp.]|nr:MmgE/PrpD family protein [Ruminococcus sp.]
MNRTICFLDNVKKLSEGLPFDRLKKRTAESLLDYLAVTGAGAKFQEDKLAGYYAFAEPESGGFTAVGTGKKLALKEAVFLNGLNGHALDFDDGTNAGIIHLGSPIFSLLLPLAQKYDISVEDMLRAAVIGYEVSFTMALSIQPGHKALGYHATGTCGVLGATVAASYMLGFTDEERYRAFAAACVSASGMLMVLDDGSELKPYNVAKSALLALTSLQLGKAGFKGHPDPLFHSRGYLKMMTGREDIELKPLMFNNTYAVEKTYTKPYASCRYTHPSIEAAVNIRNKYGVTAETVDSVKIKTYSLAVSGHDHTDIPTTYSAKMSIPYSVAVGIIFGKAGMQEFSDELIQNSDVLALTKKVAVAADDELSAAFPKEQTAIVTLKTTDGRTFTERVDFPKGEPENPLTETEFKDRYDGLFAYAGYDKAASDKIYDHVMNGGNSVRELLEML